MSKVEDKTVSGLIITGIDQSKEYSEGEVLAVGKGYRTNDGGITPLSVKVGDIVLFRKMVEVAVGDEREELFIISENTVFAVK